MIPHYITWYEYIQWSPLYIMVYLSVQQGRYCSIQPNCFICFMFEIFLMSIIWFTVKWCVKYFSVWNTSVFIWGAQSCLLLVLSWHQILYDDIFHIQKTPYHCTLSHSTTYLNEIQFFDNLLVKLSGHKYRVYEIP